VFAQTSERICFARREADVSCWEGIPEHGVLKRREEHCGLSGRYDWPRHDGSSSLILFACVRPGGVRRARGGGEFRSGHLKKGIPRGFVGVSASGKVFGDGNKNGRHP